MNDIAIRVENLSKLYHIGKAQQRHDTLRDVLVAGLRAPWKRLSSLARRPSPDGNGSRWTGERPRTGGETFWALKNVSFEVKRGEVVGIIGRNGAGKSTLLKILSRITEPTEGRASIQGRVGSLLEVGTGFHPELTGWENIYLSGAILGLNKVEIDRKIDEIVEFSGVEKFIDTPVKRYSSGMRVRLGFAVAAHLEPEVLLVDEVLAVGDAAFQTKCLGKMGNVAREGRTVLFVSHNMGAIRNLTQKSIYLVKGHLANYGETAQVLDQYLAHTLTRGQQRPDDLSFFRRSNNSDAAAQFRRIWVGENQEELADILIGNPFTVFLSLEVKHPVESAAMTLNIKSLTGDVVTTVISADEGFKIDLPPGRVTMACRIEDLHLPPGTYLVDVGINPAVGTLAWDVIIDYPAFRVVNMGPKMLTYRPDRPGMILCNGVEWYRLDGEENKG